MMAVVLAGGEGKRLKPLTQTRPKPLLPIAGRPCIDYVLRSLIDAGLRRILIATAYMSDYLIKQIGDAHQYDASLAYSFENTPAGTAGAVKRVEEFIDGTFVVAMGDVLAEVDVGALVDFHRERGGVATIALTQVSDPTEYGIVGLDARARVERFQEKPRREEAFSNLVNAGIYVLEREVLDVIPEREMFDFAKHVFPRLLEKGLAIYGKRLEGLWMDIGRPSDLLAANLEVVRRTGKALALDGVECSGPLLVAPTAVVEPGAVLRGPCFVGPGARIASGAVVASSCVYDDAEIDSGATVDHTVILERSKVRGGCEVRESVVARDCLVDRDSVLDRSIIGDRMTIMASSRLVDAVIGPPEG
ncbi:MAG TPA: NDP-sugar synthase [Thermoplasmata archaeon]|nr:NDP-sugar synthase [Thermoplasmata archaeon]